MITNKQKALLHIAKQSLGLTDTEYRTILQTKAGVTSSTKITEYQQFTAILTAFMALGFQATTGKSNEWGCTKAQQGKIQHLWQS